MIQGIFSIITACLLWALVFVLPRYALSFTPIEIALGRFFFFGLSSLVILCWKRRELLTSSHLWRKSILYGLLSTIVCYGASVLAIRYAGAPTAALLFGMSPLTISFYGNWKNKEYPFKILILPAFFLLCGAILLHQEAILSLHIDTSHLIGIGAALLSLGILTWFAVANFCLLQKETSISSFDWTLLLGISSFGWTLLSYGLLTCFTPRFWESYTFTSSAFFSFLIISLILGVISSWASMFFWNYGTKRVPVTLSGQLTVFEMLFAFGFLFLLEQRLPLLSEAVAICFVLLGFTLFFTKSRKYSFS